MRVGIMLRALEEKGGVGVYTRNITEHLIEAATDHRFFLYLSTTRFRDDFTAHTNVTVRVVRGRNKFFWDQIAIPYRFLRDELDVIFHPKFTVPLACAGRSVMVLHGAGWFIPQTRRYWSLPTRIYARLMMPIYCRSAGAVLAVSNVTRDVFIEHLGVSPEKIETVYFAPAPNFSLLSDARETRAICEKYHLPESFILTLSGADRDDRKNFGNILEAFRRIHARRRCSLVVVGRGCDTFRERYHIPEEGYGRDIHLLGWVEQTDLPAFYRRAAVFLYPSNMEAFPIPITEALASRTPIVTSNVFGLKELAADAALLVDPSDPHAIAEATLKVLDDSSLREELRNRAEERSKVFDWDRCVAQTLAALQRVCNRGAPVDGCK